MVENVKLINRKVFEMVTYEISITYRVIANNEDKARNHALGKTDDWFQCDDFVGKDGVYRQPPKEPSKSIGVQGHSPGS